MNTLNSQAEIAALQSLELNSAAYTPDSIRRTSLPEDSQKELKTAALPPVIFNYLNYQEFLNAFYQFKKKSSQGYSYAVFSKRAGVASPNYLKLVMSGARSLTNEKVLQFAKAMDLGDFETVYWENLVAFNQAKRPDQQRYYFMKLTHSPIPAHLEDTSKVRVIRDEWDYYSNWRHAAIRELVLLPQFSDQPAAIAKLLKGRVTDAEAAESLQLLLRLKFIEKLDTGKYLQTNRQVRFIGEHGMQNFAVQKFHESSAKLGVDSIQNDAIDARNFSALTIALDDESFAKVADRLTQFRKALNEEFSQLKTADKIVQMNFQVIELVDSAQPQEKS